MHSKTIDQLLGYDNSHEFERLIADMMNALGYEDVTPIAPRGGADGGKDITLSRYKERGLCLVSLEKEPELKLKTDLAKRAKGDFDFYIFTCNSYLTAAQKLNMQMHCIETLHAPLVIFDIEGLRSLLDGCLQYIRKKYLGIEFENSSGFNPAYVQLLEAKNASLQLEIDRLKAMAFDQSQQRSLAEDMEYKNYFAYYLRSNGDGPFCSSCWDDKEKKIRLTQANEYWWECKSCKNRYCSDKEAYEASIRAAQYRLNQRPFDRHDVI